MSPAEQEEVEGYYLGQVSSWAVRLGEPPTQQHSKVAGMCT
jgi:hypothetical protein